MKNCRSTLAFIRSDVFNDEFTWRLIRISASFFEIYIGEKIISNKSYRGKWNMNLCPVHLLHMSCGFWDNEQKWYVYELSYSPINHGHQNIIVVKKKAKKSLLSLDWIYKLSLHTHTHTQRGLEEVRTGWFILVRFVLFF
jgi:hypothetical protein